MQYAIRHAPTRNEFEAFLVGAVGYKIDGYVGSGRDHLTISLSPVPISIVQPGNADRLEAISHRTAKSNSTVRAEPSSPDRDKAKRKREKRRAYSAKVGNNGGPWDHTALKPGRSVTLSERLIRLEAAVILMASSDETGPLRSLHDFLTLTAYGSLESALLTVPGGT